MATKKRYRFPHTVSRFDVVGKDGQTYHVTLAWYTAVLRNPQQVFMSMTIEGPNGYHKELHGDRAIRPVMERLRVLAHEKHTVDLDGELSKTKCNLCRDEIRLSRGLARE